MHCQSQANRRENQEETERKMYITKTNTRNKKEKGKKPKMLSKNFLAKSTCADNLTGEFYKTFKKQIV